MAGRQKMPASSREASPTHTDSAQQLLALPLPESPPATLPVIAARRLWLCVHLPALPLEALNDDPLPAARAVFAEERGVRQVLLASGAAAAQGIGPGLSINAALALEPTLELAWISAFSAHVALSDFVAAVAAARKLEAEFGRDFDPETLGKIKSYAQLLESGEYKGWRESLK